MFALILQDKYLDIPTSAHHTQKLYTTISLHLPAYRC